MFRLSLTDDSLSHNYRHCCNASSTLKPLTCLNHPQAQSLLHTTLSFRLPGALCPRRSIPLTQSRPRGCLSRICGELSLVRSQSAIISKPLESSLSLRREQRRVTCSGCLNDLRVTRKPRSTPTWLILCRELFHSRLLAYLLPLSIHPRVPSHPQRSSTLTSTQEGESVPGNLQ